MDAGTRLGHYEILRRRRTTSLVRLRATPTRQLVLLQNWRSLLAEPGTTPAAAQQ